MRAKSIILFSKDSETLAAFLTALFEVGGTWNQDDVHLDFWGVPIVVKPLLGKRYAPRGETVVELEVDALEELQQIIDKSKFVEYRLELKTLNKKIDIEENEVEHHIELSDPDGRKWRISSPKV